MKKVHFNPRVKMVSPEGNVTEGYIKLINNKESEFIDLIKAFIKNDHIQVNNIIVKTHQKENLKREIAYLIHRMSQKRNLQTLITTNGFNGYISYDKLEPLKFLYYHLSHTIRTNFLTDYPTI